MGVEDSLVLCSVPAVPNDSNTYILLEYPQLAFYMLMNKFFKKEVQPGIHPTAIINKNATIDVGAEVGPYCVIGDCFIKEGAHLSSHVVIHDECVIGENTVIESHTTIGVSGIAYTWDAVCEQKIIQPQTGGVLIGQNCIIGSNVTIARGSVNENTIIGNGTTMAHGTKIAHGCVIGADNHFANSVTLAGNVVTGSNCFFSAGCVVRPMIKIANDTIVAAGAVVVADIMIKGSLAVGVPAILKSRSNEKHSGVPVRSADKSC